MWPWNGAGSPLPAGARPKAANSQVIMLAFPLRGHFSSSNAPPEQNAAVRGHCTDHSNVPKFMPTMQLQPSPAYSHWPREQFITWWGPLLSQPLVGTALLLSSCLTHLLSFTGLLFIGFGFPDSEAESEVDIFFSFSYVSTALLCSSSRISDKKDSCWQARMIGRVREVTARVGSDVCCHQSPGSSDEW